jgi:hypothetical protein
LTNEKKLDDKILDLENHLQNLTRKNFIIENYLDDEKFETQRLKLEIKKLNELNEKHLIQLDIALNNVTIEKNSLLQNNNVLNEKNERLQEIINAIKTSKFWKIRLFWFKVKAKLGIPFKDEIIWSLIIYTIIKESKHI